MTETSISEDAMELEFSEEDVAYYIDDEDGNEIGVALYDEDGNEVEYYYSDEDVEYVEIDEADGEDVGAGAAWEPEADASAAREPEADASAAREPETDTEDEVFEEEAFELEFSEEDVAYYIEDEDGNEIGFALTEPDGTETEYYYEGVDADAYVEAPNDPPSTPVSAKSKGAQPFVRRAGEEVGKLSVKAGEGAAQAAAAAKNTVRKIKDGKSKDQEEDEDLGFGLTSSQVKKAAGDFTSLAKEGAQAAAELRGVYDDIFGELDFLKPSASSRVTRRR